ncbi:MAG: hypothetical protein HOK52_14315 [Candidatus Marinimicrobia bacterium]|jgi:hypothetical protein|nr:hypothetical protein [Candidatus Neomarinimicrobiota bacterium]MBT4636334.1 hypothetical protein [Candidatus Neomarinimicrobiota bacterium]MBT4684797.1 hypothetical protein [Candidatus Neomarinimicrobiota bacterium]MBT4736400.1 hypothetical protein [Candidatus Neomarinimicrobiota bacterium]MBT5069656.1 hypothetical protein [Candidatus Neomarinimicrobiota bacterium]
MTITRYITIILLSVFLFAQDGTILPGQKSAIQSLSATAGFTDADLSAYLVQMYGKSIDNLSQADGVGVIKAFQAGTVVKQQSVETKIELREADLLEPGMKKLFHFLDGTVRQGEILSIEGGDIVLKTGSGTFNIPSDQFLSETAEITNKKGELFKGVVLGETSEEFILRTTFGDAVIQKRDIRTMKRYHGGVLDRQYEDLKKFYQGEAQLIGVFMDPTAFPLAGNTFYLSGLSVGYGLTDRFMITTKFGSNFSGDLNFHPRMRFYHRKSAEKEVAATWGIGLHRAASIESVVGRYSHAVNITTGDSTKSLNQLDDIRVADLVKESQDDFLYAEAYLVFSSRRVNPTGRGKVGWSAGVKANNAFINRDDWLKSSFSAELDTAAQVSWSNDKKYSVPFRCWLSLEYDLRKNLKFVGSAWIDNGYKTMDLAATVDDYFGDDGSDSFSLDSPRGDVSMIDFDFGLLYAVNESFRIGIHFQQPYIDFYWEFFEF